MSATTTAAVTAPPVTHRAVGKIEVSNDTSSTDSQELTKEAPEELYTPWRLAIYDFWVLGVVNSWAWSCPTTTYLLPLFRNNVRSNHLDVGVGTGYYLDPSSVPASTKLTLVDSEARALAVAKIRSQRPDARTVVADVLQPLPLCPKEKFDSVSMYYLLHCIPATVEEKCRAFRLLAQRMTPEGVLTGANVLGKGVRQDGRFAAFIRRGCTNHGIFKNKDDNAFEFEQALRESFTNVETWVVGSVFIYRATGPKV